MSELTLYTNPRSRGQIAHWMLEEVGEPYQTAWTTFGPDGHKSERLLALNPMGKLPTLVHAGHVVTEAAAICLYLADVFPQAELLPSAEERADYYRWTLFAAGPVEQAVTAKAMGWTAPAERESTLGFGSLNATVAALEGHLSGRDYVCGERFTAADVYVGSAVSWGLSFGTLPKRPALVAYAERLSTRDAYKRCREQNEAQMAAMKQGG